MQLDVALKLYNYEVSSLINVYAEKHDPVFRLSKTNSSLPSSLATPTLLLTSI